MQLQHPDLLWGLCLLIIPILVHLLRLRRYRKTPFTNVGVLQKIHSESNRSSQLKRWILLFIRLGLITALVIAFCKPFISNENTDIKKDVVVYIDNSFSMQARLENSSLLQHATQQLLQNFPEDFRFSLLTQSKRFQGVTKKELQQELLNTTFSPLTLSPDEIRLRATALFSSADSTKREFWALSDFKGWETGEWENWNGVTLKGVPLKADSNTNISVDSAYLKRSDSENLEMVVTLSASPETENGAVSLYNQGTLLAKTGMEAEPNGGFQAQFTLPAESEISGTIQVTDDGLTYDNVLYMTLGKPDKVKVLSIGPGPSNFLNRIFTQEDFNLAQTTLRELDYSILEQQHLIILNELETLPLSLSAPLSEFVEQGGSLVIIPAANSQIPSFNGLLQRYGGGFGIRNSGANLITQINYQHPVYREVFERAVDNFEFPVAEVFYALEGPMQKLIGFQDGSAFLAEKDRIYLFAAPLSPGYGNFTKSPLIVPTLYSIGIRSLPRPELYYEIGQESLLDLNVILQEDEILKLIGPQYDIIPLQQSFARKTRLYFDDEPSVSGNYRIVYGDETLQPISFNNPRNESLQAASSAVIPQAFTDYPSVNSLVFEYQNDRSVTSLWKWFIILALIFLLAEMILQKNMR